jgi:hypothetical protein
LELKNDPRHLLFETYKLPLGIAICVALRGTTCDGGGDTLLQTNAMVSCFHSCPNHCSHGNNKRRSTCSRFEIQISLHSHCQQRIKFPLAFNMVAPPPACLSHMDSSPTDEECARTDDLEAHKPTSSGSDKMHNLSACGHPIFSRKHSGMSSKQKICIVVLVLAIAVIFARFRRDRAFRCETLEWGARACWAGVKETLVRSRQARLVALSVFSHDNS